MQTEKMIFRVLVTTLLQKIFKGEIKSSKSLRNFGTVPPRFKDRLTDDRMSDLTIRCNKL
jgi:hypothetical protein